MGANSRRRREARRRRDGARQRPGGGRQGGDTRPPGEAGTARRTERLLDHAVIEVQRSLSRAAAARQADFLMSVLPGDAPVAALLATRLRRAHHHAMTNGWTCAEVERATQRRVGTAARSMLAVAEGGALSLPISHEDVTHGLRVLALLRLLPPGRPHVTGPGGRSVDRDSKSSKQLARVRALLAKAESTQFPEEAEALCAKAQELISRHALDRLLDDHEDADAATDIGTRRIWLDPPYVLAKATLVHEVAAANRCRSVVSEKLALCTVVGDPHGLAYVDLLVTSLLVQAQRSMLGQGSRTTAWGESRTRAFRQSFLLAFARRVGERLRETAAAVVAETDDAERLLPVLVGQEQHVDDTCRALFGLLTSRVASASDLEGTAAGRVAADLATLDVRDRLGDGG
jgi:hypothetical protein